MEYRKGLIWILLAVEIFLCLFLIYGYTTEKTFCLTGQGCDLVQNSQYANMFGMKLGYMGLIAFSLLTLTYTLAYKSLIQYRLYLFMTILGAVFVAYFLYIQFVVIGALCSTCLIIDSIMIIIAIISMFTPFKRR